MPRKTVRNIGRVKLRQFGKYAIDVAREREVETLLEIFAFCYFFLGDAMTRNSHIFICNGMV
jgi:hypothetical protein